MSSQQTSLRAHERRVVSEVLEDRKLFNVVISELLAGNSTGLQDVDGDRSDWIELYNPTASSIGLQGWGISDDATNLYKWTFPNVSIPAGGRLMVFASDKNRTDPSAQLHTNFKLGGSGEYLGLTNSTGTTVFQYAPKFPAQIDDISYGVLDSDPTAFRYFTTPTPNAPNTAGSVGAVAGPTFSADRGFYDAAFQLTLAPATSGASIRYTLDGSPPSETAGTLYTGPINITTTTVVRAISYRAGFLPSGIETRTYIYLDDVIHQPANIPNWPNPSISIGGTATRVHDYQMDPEIVNDPAYSGTIKKALTDVPTMSLVVKQSDMWDADGNGGFYRINDIEKPVSVEIIYANAAAKNVQADGLIEGHSDDRMKRSLRLKFNSSTPDSSLKTSLLNDAVVNGDSATNELKRLVLRAGNNRSWARGDNPDQTVHVEDQWIRDTQIALTGEGVHGNFVHLYINGLYWGLYNTAERADSHFTSTYFGGDNDDWFEVNHDGPKDGDPARWTYLTGALKDKNMAVLSNYNELKQYLDVTNLADYLLTHFYAGVTDWPGGNWWGGNRNVPAGPQKFFSWDGEYSFGLGVGKPNESPPQAWVHPVFRKDETTSVFAPIAKIFNSAKKSPEFLTLLADRAYKATANGGALTDAAAKARWDALVAQVRDAAIADSARWGDTIDVANPRTRNDHWQPEANRIRNYMTGNGADLIAALRAEGYYPATNPATFNTRGGTVPTGFGMTLSNPNSGGTIYYTLDGSDPRAVGGAVGGNAVAYTGPVTIDSATRVRVRILRNGVWSAGDDVVFNVGGTSAPVILTPPANQTVTVGQQATFSVSAWGSGTLRYQWQRNSVDIPGAQSQSYTFTPTIADSGATYHVVVSNDFGDTPSAAATLTVNPVSSAAIKINFQPAAAPQVSGYLIDSGSIYGARGGGLSYGWTVSHTANAIDRNVNANQLLDTNIGVIAASKWNLALPNGKYTVKFGVGDASVATKNNVWVEGIWAMNQQNQAANTFGTKTITATVADGKLTVGVGSAATLATRLNYIEVTPQTPATGVTRIAIGDLYTNSAAPGTNYGTANPLLVRNQPGDTQVAYLKFDLSSLPAVNTAKLRFSAQLASAGSPVTLELWSILAPKWNEVGLTWNSTPERGYLQGSAVVSSTGYATFEIDVAKYIKAKQAASQSVISFGIFATTSSAIPVQIVSRDDAANPPVLAVNQ